MKRLTPVLEALAARYEKSDAGRHGTARRDLLWDYEAVLAEAGCAEGDRRELAERELKAAEERGILVRVPIHKRDPRHFAKIRFSPAAEEALFALLGRPSPAQRRREWVTLFEEASAWPFPAAGETRQEAWQCFCRCRAEAAACWRGMAPFELCRLEEGREMLRLVAKLLAWEGGGLVRWVSSLLCGDSKLLERRQKTLEALLREASEKAAEPVTGFQSLGIASVPPGVTFHGPLRLRIGEQWRDFRGLHGPSTHSGEDVARITDVETDAARCITVENHTPFLTLAGLGSGEILVETSYPNEATLAFLKRLAIHRPGLEFWHFGDSDPNGFHILADLRARSGIPFRPLQMRFRNTAYARLLSLTERERILAQALLANAGEERCELEAMLAAGVKGAFEQEILGPPTMPKWPFY